MACLLSRCSLEICCALRPVVASCVRGAVAWESRFDWRLRAQQTINSQKRLKATFIDKVDADAGAGGAANCTDLVRLSLLYGPIMGGL